jgi:flagellar biogenesis protein FliO
MLFATLTFHDGLYLATEVGTLALVLFVCWLVPKLDHHPNVHS